MRPNRYIRDFIISYCNNKNTLKIIRVHKIENNDFLLRILKFKKYFNFESETDLEYNSRNTITFELIIWLNKFTYLSHYSSINYRTILDKIVEYKKYDMTDWIKNTYMGDINNYTHNKNFQNLAYMIFKATQLDNLEMFKYCCKYVKKYMKKRLYHFGLICSTCSFKVMNYIAKNKIKYIMD